MQCNSTSKLTYAPDGSLFGLTGPSFGISFAGPLLREHESAWVLVSLYSLGDTFLLCSHLKTFRHRHGESAQRIALVIKRSHLAIASMFSEHFDSVHVVEDAFLDQVAQHLMRYGIKSGFGPNQALFVHPHHINDTRVDEFCNIDGVSQANMYANLLRLPILSPLTSPRVNRNVQDELDHLIDRYGIRKGKSAIIFPDTNSWPGQIDEAFWNGLSQQLAGAGWHVYTNSSGNRRGGARRAALDGSKLVEIPLHLVIPLLESAGWMIGAQCGLTSIVISARTHCRKTLVVRGPARGKELVFNEFIRLKSAFPYGYQRAFDGSNYDIEEYQIRDDDAFVARAREIASGYHATSVAIPSADPVNGVLGEFSPGELIDKMTILEVKMEKLDPSKTVYVKLELDLLLESFSAKFGGLLPEAFDKAIECTRQLKYLNTIGWDLNEIIYRQFDHPVFGTADWALDPNSSADIEEAQRCVKAIRASQAANRKRIVVKNLINSVLSSSRQEKKSFET